MGGAWVEMEGGGEGCTCAGGRVDWWEVVEGVGLVRISFTSYRKQGVKIKPVPFLQPHTYESAAVIIQHVTIK